MSRMVVLMPNWLGDVVMALPALAAMREWHRSAHLAVAARQSVGSLMTLVDGVDEVIALEGRGDWRDGAGRRADAARLAEGRFDAALLLPNSFHAAWLVRQARVPERWGYAADARRWLLTRAVRRPRGATQAEYYAALVRALGGPEAPSTASLRVPEALAGSVRAALTDRGWAGEPLVAFAPGAAFGAAKRWPPDRVGQVAARLASESGATPLFVGAAGDRASIDEAIAAYRRDRGAEALLIDLGGQTDLPALAAALSRASAVVTNDSGAMHVARAVGAPVAAIFGPTDEHATTPLPHPSGQRLEVITGQAECRPCHLRDCPIDHRCMTSIDADRVARIVASLLREAS